MSTTYRSPHGSPMYALASAATIAAVFAIGVALYYSFGWLDLALANPIVNNVIYAATMFSFWPCFAGQVGGWLGMKSIEDGPLSELFWHCGPFIFYALLLALFMRADYLQSFH